MKIIAYTFLCFFCWLVLSFVSFSEPIEASYSKEPLVAYLKDGKWYFLNHRGEQLFPPKELIDVFGYSEGYIRVQMNWNGKRRWAFIDLSGNITIISGISTLGDFFNGRALVSRQINETDNLDSAIFKFGYVDNKGKLVIPLVYDDATDFREGLAFVMNKDSRGYIDTNNNFVIPLGGLAGNPFSEGLADVNNKMLQSGYIDKSGKIVIPLECLVAFPFSEGLAFVARNDTIGYIDKQGKFVITSDFYLAKKFSDSLAFVGKMFNQTETRWALIDRNGKYLTEYDFTFVREFTEGIGVVQKEGKWYFIDKKGNFVLQNDYLYIDSFANGLAFVSLANGDSGYINKDAELVIKLPKAERYFDLRFNHTCY